MTIYYSPSEQGFFDTNIIEINSIPDDKIEISLEQHEELIELQAKFGELCYQDNEFKIREPTLQDLKKFALNKLNVQADLQVNKLIGDRYPDFEKHTFAIQEQEARLWKADQSIPTPSVDQIGRNRYGESYTLTKRKLLIQKILEKSNTYRAFCLAIAGQRQAFSEQIEMIDDPNQLRDINFSFSINK